MLTYPLTKTGGVSLYEQLYRCIKDDILAGRLAAEEKLPSKRALDFAMGCTLYPQDPDFQKAR